VNRRTAARARERRQHCGIAGRRVGRQRQIRVERTGAVELRFGGDERAAAREDRNVCDAGSRAVRRADALAREADDVHVLARADIGPLGAHADERRGNRRLREQ